MRAIGALEGYLRFGVRIEPGYELKFNPWHDPDDGRFTFVGQGRYFGRGSSRSDGSLGLDSRADGDGTQLMSARPVRPRPSAVRSAPISRASATSAERRSNPHDPRNFTIHIVKAGDSLSSIAKTRKGIAASDVAWLNGISVDQPILVGQQLKLPTQAFLDDGRDAKNRFLALQYYMRTHNGALPPNPARPPSLASQILDSNWRKVSKNGYEFYIDAGDRTREVQGTLRLAPAQRRSRSAQSQAGGADRKPSDQGGHYIARRFNGPTDRFNHFAQDGSFNNREYRVLENLWAREIAQGRLVTVSITPQYENASQRPFEIRVIYRIDGNRNTQIFPNRATRGGKKMI